MSYLECSFSVAVSFSSICGYSYKNTNKPLNCCNICLCAAQFPIIEFDPETFRILLDYLHTGSCPLTCSNIPGLICAAEHYDLPELLQACFHHAKQFLRIEVVSTAVVVSHFCVRNKIVAITHQ